MLINAGAAFVFQTFEDQGDDGDSGESSSGASCFIEAAGRIPQLDPAIIVLGLGLLLGRIVGGIAGARGCIWADAAGEVFTVSVAWQGRSPTSAPANPCGQGLYGQETLRRVVSTTVRLADLN